MSVATLALILALLGASWYFLRMRTAAPSVSTKAAAAPVTKKDTSYHAVSIHIESNACAAARAIEGRRFLAADAPRLPLADCDIRQCRCRFVHHADRRCGRDRRSPFAPAGSVGATGVYEAERRSGMDRRQSDEYF